MKQQKDLEVVNTSRRGRVCSLRTTRCTGLSVEIIRCFQGDRSATDGLAFSCVRLGKSRRGELDVGARDLERLRRTSPLPRFVQHFGDDGGASIL